MNDEIARSMGFADAAEFHRMVAAADLSRADRIQAFLRWRDSDGTKAGLERLADLPISAGAERSE